MSDAEQAGNEFGAISDLYVARSKQNFATGGQAFDSDTMFKSDMAICQEMALTVNAYFENQQFAGCAKRLATGCPARALRSSWARRRMSVPP